MRLIHTLDPCGSKGGEEELSSIFSELDRVLMDNIWYVVKAKKRQELKGVVNSIVGRAYGRTRTFLARRLCWDLKKDK